MHVVFVTTELATADNASGGLASFTANMARIFAARGHKVTILLATLKEQNIEFDNNILLETTYVSKAIWNLCDKISKACIWCRDSDELRRVFISIYKSKQVKRKIKQIDAEERIDIVHYCNLGPLAFTINKNIPYVVRISGLPYVRRATESPILNCHASYEGSDLNMADKLMNYTLKKSRYIISPSKRFADILMRKIGKDSMIIESPFLMNKDGWDYSSYNSLLLGKKYIIYYTSSMTYRKGVHIVGRIIKEFLKKYPDFYFVLSGASCELQSEDGGKTTSIDLISENIGEYKDKVIILGRLVREQIYPIVENASVCLQPSRIDNLPNACIEAMAMGKIVVATDGASYEQLIDNGVNGFLCEKDNPKSFLQGIELALSLSEEEKRLMESRAVETIKRLSPDKIYEQYLNFYEKVSYEWSSVKRRK